MRLQERLRVLRHSQKDIHPILRTDAGEHRHRLEANRVIVIHERIHQDVALLTQEKGPGRPFDRLPADSPEVAGVAPVSIPQRTSETAWPPRLNADGRREVFRAHESISAVLCIRILQILFQKFTHPRHIPRGLSNDAAAFREKRRCQTTDMHILIPQVFQQGVS